jgi:hypothetical protein
LRVCYRPDGSESGSAIRTLPHTSRGRGNVDCVGGDWIDRDIDNSTTDIGWTDKPPTRISKWFVRLLSRLSQSSSLSGGFFGGSNWNAAVSHTLSNEPIFGRTLLLCASDIGLARSASGFGSFSIRANGSWKQNQLQQRRQDQ